MSPWILVRIALALAMTAALAACQSTSATPSIALLYQQPAERALIDGLRQYDGGEFQQAEASLHAALAAGLADGRDAAVAFKYLAFIACAFNRGTECALDFTQAFSADPAFRLNDVEIGHPLWGPVYRRVAQALAKPQSGARAAP